MREKGYPRQMEVGLIGSCTNSSYQDLSRAASVAPASQSERVEGKSQADYQSRIGAGPPNGRARRVAGRSAGDRRHGDDQCLRPCIGQWNRHAEDNERPNSIVTSFNRNFAKRADGNPNTHAFVASPELVVALTIAGDLTFNPLRDELINESGRPVRLDEPRGDELPAAGFEVKDNGYAAPDPSLATEVVIAPGSQRLQRLAPFAPWDGRELEGLRLLIQASGKCTTDHISMAGPWLRFRGHLENISDNLLMGAVNRFNGRTNSVLNTLDGSYASVSSVAKGYKEQGIGSIVVAEENYGEGSSREHAALEPRFLNVRAVLVKSFARIHETNLKKQGMLALTFVDPSDYDRIREDDRISITGLRSFAPGSRMTVTLLHSDGTSESFEAAHTYNEQQIGWFKAGSALNVKA